MAAAAIPIAIGAGRLAAQFGIGLAASKAIDTGINRTIPYGLSKAKEFTSKYKLTHGLSKGIGKAEKLYNSKGGKIAREVASVAGSVAAFGGSGKLLTQGGKIAGQVAKGAGQVGTGLRTALKGTRVGRVLEDQIFNPKKGAIITRGAKKFNQAKLNLSKKATEVGGAVSKQASRLGKSAGRKFESAKNTLTKPFRQPTLSEKVAADAAKAEQNFKAWQQSGGDEEIVRSYYNPRSRKVAKQFI